MHSFPPEILNEIFKLTSASTLPSVRLVCKKFNAAAIPVMFQNVTINYQYPLAKFLRKLRTISSGQLPYKAHATTLTVYGLGPYADVPEDHDVDVQTVMQPYNSRSKHVKKWLRLAITCCRRVTSVTWRVINMRSEHWNRKVIINSIRRLPLVKSLTLHTDGHSGLYTEFTFLHLLPPLEELSIIQPYNPSLPGIAGLLAKSSKTLRRLELAIVRTGNLEFMSSFIQAETLQITHLKLGGGVRLDRASIPSLRGLQSLHLLNDRRIPFMRDDTAARDTWRLLNEEGIHLQEIVHYETNESFLEYLRSYSGLKSITFHRQRRSEEMTLEEYLDALSNHANTLKDLTVGPDYEGNWSFNPAITPALFKLDKLTTLSLAIVADSSLTVERGNEKKEFGIEINEYDPTHSVCALLEAVSALPNLELLSIGFSQLADPGIRPRMEHAVHPTVQIDTHVQLYGPMDPDRFKFDLRCLDRYYRMSRVDDGYWYRYVGQVRY